MNRPVYNNTHILDDSIMAYDYEYIKELEKYCDKLEHAVSRLANVLQATSNFYLKDGKLQSHITSMYDWEDWAMKDE